MEERGGVMEGVLVGETGCDRGCKTRCNRGEIECDRGCLKVEDIWFTSIRSRMT